MSDNINITKDGLKKIIFKSSQVESSLWEIIVVTTEDKLELCLMKHVKDLEDKNWWITPLGLFLTVLLTFLTTEFKSFGWIKQETWQAIFIIAGAIFFVWLIVALKKSWKAKTIKDILDEIKKSSLKIDS